MATHTQDISIIEAVETLSSLADLEFDQETGIVQKSDLVVESKKTPLRPANWLKEKDVPKTVNLVKKTFRAILNYLRQFHKNESEYETDHKTLDGIKTIMVLVGEAAKKMDKYTSIFKQKESITQLKEYQQLQEFYRTKIARKIDDGVFSQWILGLTLGKGKEGREIAFTPFPEKIDKLTNTNHVFVDLDAVKKDTEYELFFIRKEDGSRFFSPRLLRNIHLICGFGSYFGEKKESDPFEGTKQWVDRVLHAFACEILKSFGDRLDHFFHDVRKNKGYEIIQIMNKALIALILSANHQNLLRYQPVKCCAEYFEDFQGFLRQAIQNEYYRKWMTYSSKEQHYFAIDLIEMIHTLCRAIHTHLKGMEEMKPIIQGLIYEAMGLYPEEKVNKSIDLNITGRIGIEYAAMTKLIKHHPNGPLLKVMDILEEGAHQAFDPLLQHNIPNQLFDLHVNDKRYAFLRLPAPIRQEFINKAWINDEFRVWLQSSAKGAIVSKHLLINLEDRTSWREYIRSHVLEDLQNQPEFKHVLSVVTLSYDTDFYHQLSPYHKINHANLFKEQFKDFLLDENAGYFFPSKIDRKDLSSFIDGAFESIHRLFFSSKNVLVRENRLDFIDIFYILLQLKLIDWLEPDTVSLTCKDGVDLGEASSVAIFAFLKLIQSQEWTEGDWERLHLMLYAPSLLVRERLMIPDRFNRMLNALKAIERAKHEFGDRFVDMMKSECSKLYTNNMKRLFASS